MILSGNAISAGVSAGEIVISPFDPANLEPNSYGFHLGDEILSYTDPVLRPDRAPTVTKHSIGRDGITLLPDRCYLGSTFERMGSRQHAATLYANRSVSTLGLWIQYSAPLGHSGAIIAWTLEMKAAQPIHLYRRMNIGKIAFWTVDGPLIEYAGRYVGSETTVPSRLWHDQEGSDIHDD
ncbi:deoxycytidine triphosphate deaminase (plasmid) [Embleya sp. NBC_00888]|uniref:dCTP deaminase n=1 Tax=Embleya sp. NBC_00888 TaxID=2975960 RepID=UPI002F912FFF|nr:deoxycytidine triphosphate deaminase [Embleya sp. NBC_00888]